MHKSLRLLPFMVAALAAPAMAQDETTPTETPPTEAAPAENAEPPAVGDLYEITEGAWSLVCEKTLSGEDPCNMLQLLRDPNGNPVMQAELTRLDSEGRAAVMRINTPLMTVLPRGVSLSIDEGNPARVQFLYCDPEACVARIDLRPADLAAFKRGAAATLEVVPMAAPNQTVKVTMSLDGFTAAYESMTPVAPE